nr:hypothetical protein GCM10020241_63790 [Streptoalloteichus tenebrarius]
MSSNRVTKGIEDVYELTPIQQGLLFEQLKRPEAGVYIEQLVLTFAGTLHTDAFARAWQKVVDRHPILRTSFHWRDEGLPLQVVHREAEMPLEVLDWQDIPVAEQRKKLEDWLDRERIEGFDLTKAPLMRITVIHSEPQTWQFVWRLSHLLMDGWSFGLAVTDFITAYRAECLGHEPQWGPMRPYRDYAAWWSQQDGEDSLTFWRNELEGFQPPEPLFLGGQPIEDGKPSHGFVELQLAAIEPGLKELARTNQLTLNTIVQGAWLIVLAHYYGTTDVACGFTMAHRPPELRGSETILGPLIATMPVREKLEMTRAALSWLRDLQRHIAAVRDHTTMPLFGVQRVLGFPLDVPLLESSVSYENMPMPDFALQETGMKLTEMRYDGRPHYPITMVIMPGEGMPLRVIYDRSRFSPEAAHRFCDQLKDVLTAMVEHPELTIGELSPGAAEVTPVSGGADLEIDGRTLHDTFVDHAQRDPDAEAITFGDQRLSYRELDEYSDAIAAKLIKAGVRPGGRVGLCLERSSHLVASMIAVFKGRRRLRAARPRVPRRPVGRHAGRRRDRRGRHLDRAGGQGAGVRGHRGQARREDRHQARPAEAAGDQPGRAGVRALHLGFHRPAQGRGGHPPQRAEPARRGQGDLRGRRRRRVDFQPLLRLRLLGVGDLGRARQRRPPGRRSTVDGPLAGGVPQAGADREGHDVQPDPDAVRALRRRRRGVGRREGVGGLALGAAQHLHRRRPAAHRDPPRLDRAPRRRAAEGVQPLRRHRGGRRVHLPPDHR